jgi:hypothetical protein
MSKVLALGVLLIVASAVWRMIVAQRRRTAVVQALRSDDPSVRSLALRRMSRGGIGPYASELLDAIARAGDPVRRGELAWVIASTQWEPARDARLAQLRLWADAYYRERQALRLADAEELAPPRPGAPQIPQPGPYLPAAAPGPAERWPGGLPEPVLSSYAPPPVAQPSPGTQATAPSARPSSPTGAVADLRARLLPAGSAAAAGAPGEASTVGSSRRDAPPAPAPSVPPSVARTSTRSPLVSAVEDVLGAPLLWLRYEPVAC